MKILAWRIFKGFESIKFKPETFPSDLERVLDHEVNNFNLEFVMHFNP